MVWASTDSICQNKPKVGLKSYMITATQAIRACQNKPKVGLKYVFKFLFLTEAEWSE